MNYPSFDPYQMLLRRKQQQEEDPQSFPVIQYDKNDIKELEEFCKQYNIIGFNCVVARWALKQH